MNALSIAHATIRQDAQGRYCLNDLHAAAGGTPHHRPSKWLATKQAQGLISALEQSPNSGSEAEEGKARIRALPIASVRGGPDELRGTYIAKEMVYAYAMWISPEFHLRVIDAYDALVTGEFIQPNVQHENYWFARRPHWPAIRERVLAGERYRDIAAALCRSVGCVARAVRRMIAVGLLAPAKVAQAQRGPARLAAQRQAAGWGQQLALALGAGGAA